MSYRMHVASQLLSVAPAAGAPKIPEEAVYAAVRLPEAASPYGSWELQGPPDFSWSPDCRLLGLADESDLSPGNLWFYPRQVRHPDGRIAELVHNCRVLIGSERVEEWATQCSLEWSSNQPAVPSPLPLGWGVWCPWTSRTYDESERSHWSWFSPWALTPEGVTRLRNDDVCDDYDTLIVSPEGPGAARMLHSQLSVTLPGGYLHRIPWPVVAAIRRSLADIDNDDTPAQPWAALYGSRLWVWGLAGGVGAPQDPTLRRHETPAEVLPRLSSRVPEHTLLSANLAVSARLYVLAASTFSRFLCWELHGRLLCEINADLRLAAIDRGFTAGLLVDHHAGGGGDATYLNGCRLQSVVPVTSTASEPTRPAPPTPPARRRVAPG